MISGRGLGLWSPILRARSDAREAYGELEADAAFRSPKRYEELVSEDIEALLLPGGHAQGVKEYLESPELQAAVARHMKAERPIGAICHGVVVLARAKDPETGRSVLHGRRSTGLPAHMELSAWLMTCLWLGSYYRTYPQTVQAEIEKALAAPSDFLTGPPALFRDSLSKPERGFIVRDGNYLSARWPGDLHHFSLEFAEMLASVEAGAPS